MNSTFIIASTISKQINETTKANGMTKALENYLNRVELPGNRSFSVETAQLYAEVSENTRNINN